MRHLPTEPDLLKALLCEPATALEPVAGVLAEALLAEEWSPIVNVRHLLLGTLARLVNGAPTAAVTEAFRLRPGGAEAMDAHLAAMREAAELVFRFLIDHPKVLEGTTPVMLPHLRAALAHFGQGKYESLWQQARTINVP